eukprot:CAMPEP_0201618878 /NCGR_PEP_ID=MMETSP0492-20130828/40193_1 /ASSEMBLY_ACC=CAM_ASM_000837 /TAXON_ID=420259 /ORGANISM="Thalassiosira gravida, Strain GMp14c1" /LENGTH=58 /DNA_ID=CAMNT_0048087603 /DNA_START=52 /DNA_END=224 /DNA_ORIENTATION=+
MTRTDVGCETLDMTEGGDEGEGLSTNLDTSSNDEAVDGDEEGVLTMENKESSSSSSSS